MYELIIKDNFSSAHFLRGYQGPCENLHGHTWRVEVTVQGETLDPIGLVVDFKILKQKLKSFLEKLDHVCLNDIPFFKEQNPSTENLARYIFREFAKECSSVAVKTVRVWESDRCGVTYYE